MTRKLAAAAGIAAAALGAVASGCGASMPTAAQARQTVRSYLDAATPAARCALLTTEYREQNPEVLLAGGCGPSQTVSPAEEAARRALRITRVTIEQDIAEVALAPAPGSLAAVRARTGSPQLASIQLAIDRGAWRIDGFEESSSGTATAR